MFGWLKNEKKQSDPSHFWKITSDGSIYCDVSNKTVQEKIENNIQKLKEIERKHPDLFKK